jgi:hypothetical protein
MLDLWPNDAERSHTPADKAAEGKDLPAVGQTTASWLVTDPFGIWLWLILLAVVIGLRLYNRVSRGASLKTNETSEGPGNASMLSLDPRLDPREWKKEHRVALAGAIAIGCFIGLIFAAASVQFSGIGGVIC